MSVINTQKSILTGYNPKNHGMRAKMPHHPHAMIIGCIDSRIPLEKIFAFEENTAITVRQIAAVIPKYEMAGKALAATFSFSQLKGINQIVILVHGDCGGAQITASYNPKDQHKAEKDKKAIAEWVYESGVDLEKVKYTFDQKKPETEGLVFADYLAQQIGVSSLHNLMHYPDVETKIKAGTLDVSLAYLDHINGALAIYNAEKNIFEDSRQEGVLDSHFCNRINNCDGCNCTTHIGGNVEQHIHKTHKRKGP